MEGKESRLSETKKAASGAIVTENGQAVKMEHQQTQDAKILSDINEKEQKPAE